MNFGCKHVYRHGKGRSSEIKGKSMVFTSSLKHTHTYSQAQASTKANEIKFPFFTAVLDVYLLSRLCFDGGERKRVNEERAPVCVCVLAFMWMWMLSWHVYTVEGRIYM